MSEFALSASLNYKITSTALAFYTLVTLFDPEVKQNCANFLRDNAEAAINHITLGIAQDETNIAGKVTNNDEL